ncbi:MAG: HEAT repeat domain-containing protein [Elusimicrobiota bacterium]
MEACGVWKIARLTFGVLAGAAAFRLGWWMDMRRSTDPVAQDIARLSSAKVFERAQAAAALGLSRDPRVIEPLMAALKDPADAVQANAAMALGKLRDPRAAGALRKALEDDNADVRRIPR